MCAEGSEHRTAATAPPEGKHHGWASRIAVWLGWTLAGLASLLLVLALAGWIYQRVASAAEAKQYPPPGRMVDLGGYRLHLICQGKGEPTVLLDTVVGGSSLSWALVQPEVARTSSVCAFDRPGYGWSDPGPGSRTSGRIVDELHRALEKAALSGPYVLVGASFGGCNLRLFALRYPELTSGLVLIDSAHEDQIERMPPSLDPAAEMGALRLFRIASRLGVLRVAGMPVGEGSMGFLPREQEAAARAVGLRSSAIDAIFGETGALKESFAQVRRARASAGKVPFGSRPLVVLTHEENRQLAGEEAKAYRIWVELQAELAAESTAGRQIIVKPSGHFIAVDQPERVVEAIREVVQAVRNAGEAAGTSRSPD